MLIVAKLFSLIRKHSETLKRLQPFLMSIFGFSFLIAFIYQLFYDSTLLSYYSGARPGATLAVWFFSSLDALLFFLIVLLLYPLTYFLLFFVFIVSSVAAYFVFFYKVLPDADALPAVFNTNVNELEGWISWQLALCMAASIALAGGICWLLGKNKHWQKFGKIRAAALAAIFLLLGVTKNAALGAYYMPEMYLFSSAVVVSDLIKFHENKKHKYDFSDAAFEETRNLDKLKIIIVLGEAARRDHFSLYGYPRVTTPYLDHLQNMVYFKNATSCGSQTLIGVPCIFTRKDKSYPVESSFLKIFERLNFSTYWISNQSKMELAATSVTMIADESQHEEFSSSHPFYSLQGYYDEVALPHLKQALDHDKRQLIVIHTLGNHMFYDDRYPPQFRKFQPTCDKKYHSLCAPADIINAYDNTVYYTDHVLNEIIDTIKNEKALLIYVSDHAESLGEGGYYGHALSFAKHPEEFNIPMFVWVSPAFLQDNPDILARMGQKRDGPINQFYIFHSLLDCLGIASPIIDRRLSLCANSLNR